MQDLFSIETIQTAIIGFLSLGAAIGAAIAAIKGYSAKKPQSEPADPLHIILSKLELIHEDVNQLESKADALANQVPLISEKSTETSHCVSNIDSNVKILLDRTQRGSD